MKKFYICFVFITLFFLFPRCVFAQELPLELIKLPPGFEIEVFVNNVLNARSMTMGEKGTLFVGTRSAGNVYAILDTNQARAPHTVVRIAKGLRAPNGVAFFDGALYVAEVSRIWRFDQIEKDVAQKRLRPPKLISDQFPTDTWHGWKFIRFGPDNRLYIPVGAPCNICERVDLRYASILRMNADGSGLEVFARGIRNTVGFDWDPATSELWFTDNGGDDLGDDLPPDELNHAEKPEMHFGYPYCHAGDFPDPEYGKKFSCSEFTPPAQKLGPHVAALGMRFYTGAMFPKEYHNQIFIAEHGSWNRSKKIGYRISLVRLKDNRAVSYETFAEGWLTDGNAWGRPVDLQILDDGSMLVSDDFANVIYRIYYAGPLNEP